MNNDFIIQDLANLKFSYKSTVIRVENHSCAPDVFQHIPIALIFSF